MVTSASCGSSDLSFGRLHILVVPSWYHTAYAPLSGTFFSEQAEALARAGHRVGVIYPDQRSVSTILSGSISLGPSVAIERGVTVYRHGTFAAPKMHIWNGQRWVRAVARILARYALEQGMPDVIHAQSAMWAGVAASRIWRSTGVPFVLTEHSSGFARGMFNGKHRPFVAEAFDSACEVVAVSEALRRQLQGVCARKDIRVVPNSVDTTTFTLPLHPRPRNIFRFVCIAILEPNKAVDLLLRAFAAAFAGSADVRLDIVGDGPEGPRLRRLSRRLDVASQVTFHGARDRGGVREVLWASHCFVSSSRVETFGVTLIEALATGIPIVATRSGGPEDIVTPECGILTAADSAADLQAAMLRMHDERDVWSERAPVLRAAARARFGQDVIAERMGAIFSAASNRRDAWRPTQP